MMSREEELMTLREVYDFYQKQRDEAYALMTPELSRYDVKWDTLSDEEKKAQRRYYVLDLIHSGLWHEYRNKVEETRWENIDLEKLKNFYESRNCNWELDLIEKENKRRERDKKGVIDHSNLNPATIALTLMAYGFKSSSFKKADEDYHLFRKYEATAYVKTEVVIIKQGKLYYDCYYGKHWHDHGNVKIEDCILREDFRGGKSYSFHLICNNVTTPKKRGTWIGEILLEWNPDLKGNALAWATSK